MNTKPFKSLNDIQSELFELKSKAFAEFPSAIENPNARALNITEEAGELAREERLSIDGFVFNEAKAQDAIGDILIATLGYCIARGWSAQLIIEQTLEELKHRWIVKGQLIGDPNDFTTERVTVICEVCNTSNEYEIETPIKGKVTAKCLRCDSELIIAHEEQPIPFNLTNKGIGS